MRFVRVILLMPVSLQQLEMHLYVMGKRRNMLGLQS